MDFPCGGTSLSKCVHGHSSRLCVVRFINICYGCSRQLVYLLRPITSSLSVFLSQVCRKLLRSSERTTGFKSGATGIT